MEAYDRKLRSGELFARRRIDGIKENQRQIAKQLSSIRSDGHDKSQERLADKVATVPTSTLDKVRTRLSELEQISKDINKNIDHIDAVVAIKDNYLHQLRTAETLLARYNAAQTSGDDDQMDQAEIFHAAYTVIMHNVPRRYNPEANNKDGHETIAQVIARLEDEVSDLNSKAAEERFEVKMEETLLSSLVNTKNIKQVEYMLSHNQAMEFENLCDGILKTIIDARMKTFPWSEIGKSENGLADIERMQQIKRNLIQRLINSLDMPRKTGDKEPDLIKVTWGSAVDDNAILEKITPATNYESTGDIETPEIKEPEEDPLVPDLAIKPNDFMV